MLWYFVLRGAASFLAEVGRWPGSPSSTQPSEAEANAEQREDTHVSPLVVDLDIPVLNTHVGRVLAASGVAANSVSVDYVHVSFPRGASGRRV